jgi:hypothetical protein
MEAAKLRRRAEPHRAEKPQLCGSLWAHGGAGAKPAQSWRAGRAAMLQSCSDDAAEAAALRTVPLWAQGCGAPRDLQRCAGRD